MEPRPYSKSGAEYHHVAQSSLLTSEHLSRGLEISGA